ncbi:MAG TPA: hypothetical protein VIK55_06450 [Paludibacter sp.]
MKQLLESYRKIIENCGESKIELANDMNLFNLSFTTKVKLIPFDYKELRPHCKDCKSNMFLKNSGSFCPECGFILPF